MTRRSEDRPGHEPLEPDELERRLRRALHEEADLIEPGGNGLAEIRARSRGRRRAHHWGRSGVAVLAAAAAVAAVAVVPRVLGGPSAHHQASSVTTGSARSGRSAAADASRPLLSRATPSAQATRPAASPAPSAGKGVLSVAPKAAAGPQTNDGTRTGTAQAKAAAIHLVWPYSNVGTARSELAVDTASGARFAYLRQPGSAATQFVRSVVGNDVVLQAKPVTNSSTAKSAAITTKTVRVLRVMSKGRYHVVCDVHLLSMKAAGGPVYLIRDAASADGSVTLYQVPRVAGTKAIPMSGTAARVSGMEQDLDVSLRVPGSTDEIAHGTAPLTDPWSVLLNPYRRLSSSGLLAAWTVDEDGKVLSLAAQPTS